MPQLLAAKVWTSDDKDRALTNERYRKGFNEFAMRLVIIDTQILKNVNMTENKNIREREKSVREIEKTAKSICKKHRALKIGKIEEDIATKNDFKPIIELLQKIVDNSSLHTIKDEPRDDDVSVEMSFLKGHDEEEETPR